MICPQSDIVVANAALAINAAHPTVSGVCGASLADGLLECARIACECIDSGAAARLTPQGAGPLAPVASNKSEEGRARNRRVELVEQ
jgi:hypothetical protein